MASFYLINTVVVGTTKVFAGDLINDAVDDAGAIRSAGGLLWPVGDAVITAAALKAQNARVVRGANEIEIDSIMQQAVDALQLSVDGDAAYRLVQNWYIHAVTGNDSNDGLTAATALKTHAALMAKWGRGSPLLVGAPSTVISSIQLIAVNILSDLPSTDPIILDVTLPANTLLAYVGVATTLRTGVLTAGTVAKDRLTNTPQLLEDTVTPFTVADVGRRIRITAGTGGPSATDLGQFAWGAKHIAGLLRTSSFSTPTMGGTAPLPDCLIQSGLTTGAVAAGSTYVVEALSKVYITKLNVKSPFGGPNTAGTLGFANIDIQNSGGGLQLIPVMQNSSSFNFKGCLFSGAMHYGLGLIRMTVLNCCFKNGLAGNGPVLVRGGLSLGLVASRGYSVSTFDDDFMCHGPNNGGGGQASGAGFSIQKTAFQFGTACCFDSNFAGFGVGIDSGMPSGAICHTAFSGTHLLWGSGNGADGGVHLKGGCTLSYQTNVPIVTGSGGDFILAAATTGSSFDNATGLISTPTIANTWANMAVAAPVGFGGNAHNFERNAHIVVRG